MKKIIYVFFLTAFMNAAVYGAGIDDYNAWKENYDCVFYEDNNQTYVCQKDIGENESVYYVTDTNGNVIFESSNYVIATDDADRYIICCEDKQSEEKYDYIADKTGSALNECKYSTVRKIAGINAYVAEECETDDISKWGIIDDRGNILLPFFECDYIANKVVYGGSYDGFLEFRDFEKDITGFIDKNDFSRIITVKTVESEVIHIADENTVYKEKLLENKSIFEKYENGEFVPYKDTSWTILGNFGEEGIAEIIDYENEKHGIVDKELNIVCEPKYDNYFGITNSYIIVQYGSTDQIQLKDLPLLRNGKYGVIDKYGNEVIKCEYDRIIRDENNSFICIKDRKKNIVFLDKPAAEPKCSEWAKESVISGNIYGIVPEELNRDFSEKITREEFCKLAVKTFFCHYDPDEYILQNEIKNYFDDTNNKYVMIAHYNGIVSGKEERKFCPNDAITRQEAAVMLANIVKNLNYYTDVQETDFADEEYFADWARESIYKVSSIKGENGISVMTGTGNGKFSPNGFYSKEQAIVTMIRINDTIEHIYTSDYDYYEPLPYMHY